MSEYIDLEEFDEVLEYNPFVSRKLKICNQFIF